MKNILKILFLFLLVADFLNATDSDCLSKYKCTKIVLPPQNILDDLNCTLPSENAKMRIIAKDVFDDYGKLKTYFGTVDTVCEIEN